MWVSLIWMASVLSFCVGQTAQLTANPRVEARCGQNVTMTCDINIRDPRKINLFQWIAKNETCKHGENRAGAKFVCQSEEKRLSLTVLNVMPGDQGDYLCKLRSETGAKSHKTVLVIPSCNDAPVLQVNESQAFCCYTGVYPRGFIHWFQGDDNLTDSAIQLPDVEDKDGRYNVCSALPTERRNMSHSFVCSLWSTSTSSLFSVSQRYNPSVEQNVFGAAVSLRANLTVVLIMAAAAIKGIFQRLMIA